MDQPLYWVSIAQITKEETSISLLCSSPRGKTEKQERAHDRLVRSYHRWSGPEIQEASCRRLRGMKDQSQNTALVLILNAQTHSTLIYVVVSLFQSGDYASFGQVAQGIINSDHRK